jgi:colanic acid/amylovoran biosynthesis glycosyltransferase
MPLRLSDRRSIGYHFLAKAVTLFGLLLSLPYLIPALNIVSLTIAYLVNQYPKVSHSFIRREIMGVEACGIRVLRFSIRSRGDELVDEADRQELANTRFVLGAGIPGLLGGLLRVAITRPLALLRGLGLALRLGRKSDQGILRHLAYFAEACVLFQWFKEAGVAHLHAHFGTNSTTVALLCHAIGGPPYSFTIHGPEEFDRLAGIALVEKIQRAAFVVAISSFGRSQIYRWCSHDAWPKIHVVHCGVDQTFLGQPSTPIPETAQLTCIGRLCEQKGQLLLLDAIAQLTMEGLPVKLVLVGDGELRSELETLIVRFRLQDQVTITGWANSDDVRQQILNARAMVLPSFAEGLPVVIMEALALGRPVISTYIAGIPELVEPGVCGWLVPPGAIVDLKQVIRTVVQLPVSTLEEMGQAGKERVAHHHQANLEARKLAQLFQESITKSQPQ